MPKKNKNKIGLPPGTLVYTGPDRDEKVHIDLFIYNETSVERFEKVDLQLIEKHKNDTKNLWMNVSGVHDIEIVDKIGKIFGIHSLFLEDIVNIGLRPKIDEHSNYIYACCKMVYFVEDELRFESINLLMGANYVISFQEVPGDVLDPIRTRIVTEGSKIRKFNTDFLFYSIIDAVADHYFLVLENLGEKLEELEDEIEENNEHSVLFRIQHQKKNVIKLRRSVYPLREIVSKLEKSENPIMKEQTIKYIRDLYEHVIQIIETTESYRDFVSSLTDLYLSKVSNKMNNIMQMLTVMATIFIPLTFIAGIYGMNFDFMPELHWKYGYFAVWVIMISVVIVMIIYFRRKRWI